MQALGVAFNDMSHMLVPDFVRDFKVNYPVGYQPARSSPSFLQMILSTAFTFRRSCSSTRRA